MHVNATIVPATTTFAFVRMDGQETAVKRHSVRTEQIVTTTATVTKRYTTLPAIVMLDLRGPIVKQPLVLWCVCVL